MAKAGASGAGAGKPRAPRSGAARGGSPRAKAAAPQAEGPELVAAADGDPAETAEPTNAPEETAPGETAPGETAPEETAPEETAPEETAATNPPTVAPRTRQKKAPGTAAPRKAAKGAPRKAAPAGAARSKAAQTDAEHTEVEHTEAPGGAAADTPPAPPAAPLAPAPPVPSAPAKVAAAKAGSSASTARATSPAPAKAAPAKAAPAKAAPASSARGLPDEIGGYRILGALGRGGMGAVYRARDGDGRIVALKLLHAHLDDPDARERLTREVASLQKVRHAGVARVLDAEIESTEAFVVTELVTGRDLGKHVKRNGPLPADQLVVLATRLREALDVVHGAGVLHRDLTPGNVMVTAEGPVLIDFGLAQAVEDARVTSTGLVTGTPGYVSPDLLDGDAPSRASDWWGWAAVLTFAATGRPPFGRGAIGTVLTRVRAGEPDLAGLAEPVARALRSALAVGPDDRATPDEVVEALEAAATADADGADDADDPAEAATIALDPGADPDDAQAETVVAVAPTDVLPAGEWVHDGGTTVMPVGAAEAWAAEDDEADEADEQAYGEADDDGADDRGHDAYADQGYDVDEAYDDPYDDAYDEGDDAAYDDELAEGYEPAYYPQPLTRRTGTVAALALPFLALGLARPGAAFVAALVVAALLRSVELDVEALERRRARRGARPSDGLRALLTWPWYLVRGTLGVVPVLVVGGAVVVLVGGVTWWLIEAGHWTVAPLVPGVGSGLLRGNLPWVGRAWVGVVAAVGLAMVWFGPMARTHRDGARRVLAKAAPGVPGVLAAVVVGLVVAALLADAMLAQDVVWWPLGGPPDIG